MYEFLCLTLYIQTLQCFIAHSSSCFISIFFAKFFNFHLLLFLLSKCVFAHVQKEITFTEFESNTNFRPNLFTSAVPKLKLYLPFVPFTCQNTTKKDSNNNIWPKRGHFGCEIWQIPCLKLVNFPLLTTSHCRNTKAQTSLVNQAIPFTTNLKLHEHLLYTFTKLAKFFL